MFFVTRLNGDVFSTVIMKLLSSVFDAVLSCSHTGGSRGLRNVCKFMPDYTASYSARQ